MNRAQGKKIPTMSIIVAALVALLLAALPAGADDRDLLRDSVSDPYVFIIFDTSGSMHWTPPCSAAHTTDDIDPFDGACTYECTMGATTCEKVCPSFGCVEYSDPTDNTTCVRMGYRCQQSLCPNGDCFTNMNGDDPSSKLFQAKQAMFEVLQQVDNVQFGFATYEQDSLRVESKHWLYEMRSTLPDNSTAQAPLTLPSGAAVISAGDQFTVGRGEFQGWNCVDTSNANGRISCEYDNPSDLTVDYEMERLRRMPKLGLTGVGTRTSYVRENFSNNRRYRLTFEPESGDTYDANPNGYDYGEDFIAMKVTLHYCDNPFNFFNYDCTGNNATFVSRRTLYFNLISDFLAWDAGANRGPVQKGYNSQSLIDLAADNTCGGWDPNTDTSGDDYRGLYNYRWPTPCDTNPAFCDSRGAAFNRGDVIPLDWLDDNKDEIMQRFSPNQINPANPPDFRSAVYFNDQPDDANSNLNRHLTLVNTDARPIISQGSTPLGASLADFRNWYDSWSGVAAAQDPDWACRRKYVLFITDGDETCGGNACSQTATLAQQRGVRTFVVGFGLTTSPTLDCMASNGGTGQPIFPRNKDDLVDALTRIFSQIRTESRAFASASVPAIQSTAADKIFLSSFTPLPSASVWPGRVDAFRLPLVLTPQGTPDIGRQCSATLESGCHLWDAGEVLKTQAPTVGEVAGGSLRLGGALTQRRLFYGKADLFNPLASGGLRLLDYPATPQDEADLRAVFLDYQDDQDVANNVISLAGADQIVRDVIGKTLAIKEDNLVDPSTGATTPVQYILGDIFHANPKITDSPKEGRFFLSNLCGVEPGPNSPPDNCIDSSFFTTPEEHDMRGYETFLERFLWRRRMLIVPSNDGQLHFFDAGVRKEINGQDVFTDGTGTELFSYMPRLAMPIVRDLARDTRHIYAIDSTVTVKDVFIDPVSSPLLVNQREWRTVIVGGMREGGRVFETTGTVDKFKSGYYALDITQPDELQNVGTAEEPKYVPTPVGDTLPSCLSLNTSTGNLEPNATCSTLSGEPIEFPKELWTFTDRYYNPLYAIFGNNGLFELDEDLDPTTGNNDGNGFPDLGQTWSEPVIGPIRVCPDVLSDCDPSDPDNDLTTKWVAIFGGGSDRESKAAPRFGNFLYMVDIETGETVYKRQLEGAAPSTPTVLDRNNDGNLDTVYIGTTDGFLYKVNLDAVDSSGEVPALENYTLKATNLLGASALAPDVTVQRVVDEAWDPFKIFDTDGRPLYIASTALFIPERGQYALAFGSGDRDDLWDFNGQEGRFYLLLDDDFDRVTANSSPTPTEASLQQIGFDSALNPNADFVLNSSAPLPGWVITLPADVRVTARSFGLLGVLIFTAFEPQVVNVSGDIDGDGIPDTACARTGVSRVFAVNARNADAVAPLSDPSGAKTSLDGTDRFSVISDFTTAPFVTDTATKNPPGGGVNTSRACSTPAMEIMMQRLKRSFFPRNCNFNDAVAKCVALNESGTVLRDVAKIPTATCPSDWSLGEPVWLQHQPTP